ncbi:MAG: toll/interleukin-1 receptor domain-containing protein [Chlorobiaceae bacterium]|nr:toll/interleukin-1 receptor domain-containing protein [Chlorobiaceae bacterium]
MERFLGWAIPSGKSFRQHIKEQLDADRCVVVVWSKHSVNSHWVLEEAEAGRKQTILVPLRIDRIDPPFGFGSIQAADLTGWNNDPGYPQFRICIGAFESIVSPSREAARVNELSISRKPKPVSCSQGLWDWPLLHFLWLPRGVRSTVVVVKGGGFSNPPFKGVSENASFGAILMTAINRQRE